MSVLGVKSQLNKHCKQLPIWLFVWCLVKECFVSFILFLWNLCMITLLSQIKICCFFLFSYSICRAGIWHMLLFMEWVVMDVIMGSPVFYFLFFLFCFTTHVVVYIMLPLCDFLLTVHHLVLSPFRTVLIIALITWRAIFKPVTCTLVTYAVIPKGVIVLLLVLLLRAVCDGFVGDIEVNWSYAWMHIYE